MQKFPAPYTLTKSWKYTVHTSYTPAGIRTRDLLVGHLDVEGRPAPLFDGRLRLVVDGLAAVEGADQLGDPERLLGADLVELLGTVLRINIVGELDRFSAKMLTNFGDFDQFSTEILTIFLKTNVMIINVLPYVVWVKFGENILKNHITDP
jgi:hypothetical protein